MWRIVAIIFYFRCHLNLWWWHGFLLHHQGIWSDTSEVWFMELAEEIRMDVLGRRSEWMSWGGDPNGCPGEEIWMDVLGRRSVWMSWGGDLNGCPGEEIWMDVLGRRSEWMSWGGDLNGCPGEEIRMDVLGRRSEWMSWGLYNTVPLKYYLEFRGTGQTLPRQELCCA